MTDRPHCLNRDACAAVTPGKHCRRCCNRAMHANPEIQARRIARAIEANRSPEFRKRAQEAAIARYRDPVERQKTGAAVRNALASCPEKKARHKAAAIRNGCAINDRGKLNEGRRRWIANMTPEERKRVFGRRGYKAGLYGDDLALYLKLNKSGIPWVSRPFAPRVRWDQPYIEKA